MSGHLRKDVECLHRNDDDKAQTTPAYRQEYRDMTKANVPPYNEMLWPVVQAVAELGGSASIGEIVETAIKREAYSDAQQAVLHNDGPETEIGYRLAWARTYLKGMGLLTNSARGVWALTGSLLANVWCGLLVLARTPALAGYCEGGPAHADDARDRCCLPGRSPGQPGR
jgi:hypothetical protein